MKSLNRHTRVEGGYASVRSVASMEKEDHMHSFFLAETCKYLFLLSNDTFWRVRLLSAPFPCNTLQAPMSALSALRCVALHCVALRTVALRSSVHAVIHIG